MKRTCGIDLKGSEARLVVLEGNSGQYEIVTSAPSKLVLVDASSQAAVQQFRQDLISFLSENAIDVVGIKERATKGKFAGGSVSFKIEGLIQSTEAKVALIHSRSIKAKMKNTDMDYSQVKKYQEEAMNIAWVLLGE